MRRRWSRHLCSRAAGAAAPKARPRDSTQGLPYLDLSSVRRGSTPQNPPQFSRGCAKTASLPAPETHPFKTVTYEIRKSSSQRALRAK